MLDLATIDQTLMTARPPKEGKNILTPICRMSFPNILVAVPKNRKKPDSPKVYQLSILIPPTCDISLLKTAAGDCAKAKWGADKVKELKIKNPFLKAEEFKREGYLPGWILMRLSSKTKPTVLATVNGSRIKLTEDNGDEVYPGRWCTVSVNPFPYDEEGNKGISFGLNNVMLLNHDDSIGGRAKAEDEFEGDFGTADATTSDDLFA